MALLTRIKYLP
jgi:hypothetical protein